MRWHLEPLAIFARQQRIGRGIGECLAVAVEGELLAEPEGDIAQVAQAGAEVADLDVGVRCRAALDAIEEVLDVPGLTVLAAGALLRFASPILDAPVLVVDDQGALVTVEGDAEA